MEQLEYMVTMVNVLDPFSLQDASLPPMLFRSRHHERPPSPHRRALRSGSRSADDESDRAAADGGRQGGCQEGPNMDPHYRTLEGEDGDY